MAAAMTGKPVLSCEKCRKDFTPGRHVIDPLEGRTDLAELSRDELERLQPYEVPCPDKVAAQQAVKVQELAKLAHVNAWAAAQQIMRDVADELPQFHANLIRDRFEQAGVPPSLNGSAFTWARDKGLIERVEGESVWSTKQTTKHDVKVWRSLRYRQGRAS